MKTVIYLLLLISAVFSGACNETTKTEEFLKKEYALSLDTGEDNPRNSEGDFISLRDGRILFVYSHYTGTSADDHAHAYLAGRYSSDNGRTWTSEDITVVEQEGKMNVMSVSLLRLQNGRIALFYLRKNSDSDCIPMIRFSDDEAETWSEPSECITDRDGYFVLNNCRVIQTDKGRLMMAVALHKSPGDTIFSSHGKIHTYYSDDEGLNWTAGGKVPDPDSVILQEPGLVELKDGKILMYMRTMSGFQYFSYSDDKGKTWSSAEKSNIPSPCSPASITRMPSNGNLLLLWNDNGKDQKRTPLNIAISKDEGRTWIRKKTIENNPDGSFCYPAIHFLENEVLITYFDWTTRGSSVIRVKNNSI